MPLVSVIIPAYNTEEFIGQAIASALMQTLDDVEVIVVDDGSTDGTGAAVQSVVDPRVKYVYQENQERSAARNHGMALSTGEYLAFLDADDWWEPTKLEKQIALFSNNPRVGLAGCWLQPIAPHGKILPVLKGFLDPSEGGGAMVFERLLFGGLPGPGSATVVPKSVISSLGGFRTDLRYGEDWEFALRVAAHHAVAIVPEPLLYYRVYGHYMPQKMSQLGQQSAFPSIIMAALQESGLDEGSTLGRRALAHAYYYSGLVDAGIGDYAATNERFAQAKEIDESMFVGRRPPLIEPIAYFASALYDTTTPLAASLAYIRELFASLSSDFSDLKRALRQTLSLACAIRVFQSETWEVDDSVPGAFAHALYYDPSWVRNSRFIKLGVHSLMKRG